MPLLISESDVVLADPARLAAVLIEHMLEHDVAFKTQGARTVADLGVGLGVAALEAGEGALRLRIEAQDCDALEALRSVVAEHVIALAAEEVSEINWRGCVATGAAFANFREVRLKRAADVGAGMRRLTFAGDVARFVSDSDLHVRMYFPPDGVENPTWPRPGPQGGVLWPAAEIRPSVRYYTIRRVNQAEGEIDIDVLLRDDPGPGAAFAAAAREGAICGMAGPLGGAARPAAFTLFAGDETAIPAIARMLEAMPAAARGAALIEIGDAAAAPKLIAPAGVAIRWLSRNGAPAGTTTLLIDALRAAEWPEDPDLFVWAACEASAARDIRGHLRRERSLARERCLVAGYWERGRLAERNVVGES